MFDGYDIISPILRILKDEKLMFPKENLLLAVKILGRFFAFHKKKEEYAIARKKERKKKARMKERRHVSHQNPDHLADAEVGWKCDEFLAGRRFYPDDAFGRRLQSTTKLPQALRSELAHSDC